MANAIYNCNWELIHDNKVKMALTFMIQRCQKEQRLTAAGIADLDFISYIKVNCIKLQFCEIYLIFAGSSTSIFLLHSVKSFIRE